MAKTQLLFGIHMHQPVDNFREVIDHAVEVCYAPFFEVMGRYPEFRFAVHCSGWLMEQIETRFPELYDRIRTLAKKGSIEFFTAGYYEPILSVIPPEDRVAQIGMLSGSIDAAFGQEPKGLWLTERVWESSVIPDLERSGVAYTVTDDYHFQCAGFDEAELDGYYMSEEGGAQTGLFPISKKLRYAIPFLNVEGALKAVKSYRRESDSAAIIFDDAEKFGMWPGTHEWVYEKGWLEHFVRAVLADGEIETVHFRDYYARQRPRGIAYLPNVSYYEMGEWSLRAKDALTLERLKAEMGRERYEREGVKFLKGGIWKNFFVKYEESNRLHKRMLELSRARAAVDDPAYDENLFKLQTNDALWHGVFGGLYLPNLRDNAYRHLIACEDLRYGGRSATVSDRNELDGHPKIKMVTPEYIFRFDAAHGGQLVEFDSRRDRFNWQNTLTRREEAYHRRIFEEPQSQQPPAEEGIDTIHNAMVEIDETLRDAVIYDWYLKHSFVDHVSDESFSGDTFRRCSFREYGDFANQPFESEHSGKGASFRREGGLYFPEKSPARLEKRFVPKPCGIDFVIDLTARTSRPLRYVMEHNFHFADYDAVTVNGEALGEAGQCRGVKQVVIADGHLGRTITITLETPFDLHYFRLETLSQSEKGFDLTPQCVSFAMVVPFGGQLSLRGALEAGDV
jgi:hypothetical protein